MITENSGDEIDNQIDPIPGSDLLFKFGPLGDYNPDEISHMADWWRTFRDGRYDNLPAT